jgi:hypothetical protein
LGRHGPTKARRGLGPGWTTVFTLRAGTVRPKNRLSFPGLNLFDTKHDGLGPGWPGPAQFAAPAAGTDGWSRCAMVHAWADSSGAQRKGRVVASWGVSMIHPCRRRLLQLACSVDRSCSSLLSKQLPTLRRSQEWHTPLKLKKISYNNQIFTI